MAAAVDDDLERREWQGPYPLHDLASVLLALGADALAVAERRPNELPAHHPLMDARQSARQLVECLKTHCASWWLVELCHDTDSNLMGVYRTDNKDFGSGVMGRTTSDISLAKRHSYKLSAVYSAMLSCITIGGAWKAVFKTPNV